MSDVTKKMIDCEHFSAIELTDQDLEKVGGGQFWGGFPFGFGESFAITSIAFAGGFGGFW